VMIESQLRPTGVVDPAIVGAFAAVERENFVPESLRPLAFTPRTGRQPRPARHPA